MSVIVFGGMGFVGIPLIRSLQNKQSIKIMIHENDTCDLSVQKFSGDLLKSDSFIENLEENDIVVNLVGQISTDYSKLVRANIDGGLNLLNACIKKKVKKIILILSINVYGENLERPSLESDPLKPETNYGHVKMLTEMMYKHFAERYDLDITILRLANLYGENKKAGFVSKLLNSINSPNEKLKPHNFGNQEMDVLHIDDAVNGIIKAINTNLNGFHIINISSGMKYSIKQMIKIIEKISKKQMLIEYVEQRDAEICIWANNMKAKKILNFEPNLPIEEGFRLTIQSILKN